MSTMIAPPPPAPAEFLPLSTPRRRLHEALRMEALVTAEMEKDGWALVVKAGRKLGGRLVLITAHYTRAQLRVSVYEAASCRLQEIRRACDVDLVALGGAAAKRYVNGVLDAYTLDDKANLKMKL